MLGFCDVDENPFGPLHEYVLPPLEDRLSVFPEQTGVLLDAVGVGMAFTVALVVAVLEQLFELVTVTV
jgi:hypothetical protein